MTVAWLSGAPIEAGPDHNSEQSLWFLLLGSEMPKATEEEPYSRTLSSSFLRPQSAAAWTNASTSGCGLSGFDKS
jgi:hypothetical protein